MNDLPKNVKIAVAVSGGADSVVLLHKLVAVAAECGLSLSVVHCEHGIRGEESIGDAEFVRNLSKRYGLECQVFSADCPTLAKSMGVSLEVAARNFRYHSFEAVLARGVDYVALAHHKDDAAETALFRLCRGTSLGGVLGMTAVNGRYLRPMLDESKDEILSYATKNGLEYREDSTNFERDATRNCLRLDVMPALETVIPGAKENLLAFGSQAKEDDEYLCKLASELVSVVEPQNEADTGKCVKIAPPPLFRRACLMVLKEIGFEKDYTKKHLQAIVGLCEAQTGTKIVLPMGITAVRAYDQVKFFVGDVSSGRLPEYPFGFGEFEWGRYALNVSKEALGCGAGGGLPLAENGKLLRVDVDQVPAGAIIRTRKEGDCFRPFGGGKKSLKKYLIDRKIPLAVRNQLPLVAMGNEVLAIFGVEIADVLKITNKTKNTAFLAVQTKLTEDK